MTHKEEERKPVFEELFQQLRFALLKTPELLEINKLNLIANNEVCRKLIEEAIQYHSEVLTQPFYNGNLNISRGIYALVSTSSKLVCLCIPHKNSCKKHTSKKTWNHTFEPKLDTRTIKTVAKNNFLFVLGVNETNNTNCMKRFDPRTGEWMNLCPVPQQPLRFTAVAVLEKHIICAGGMYSDYSANPESAVRKNVWKYDIADNSWASSTELPEPTFAAAACTVESTGHVWMVGGLCRINSSQQSDEAKRVFKFDSRGDIWSTKPPMLQRRLTSHVVCDATSGLFVAGGIGICNEDSYCEMFSFETEQWSYLKGFSILNSTQSLGRQCVPSAFYSLQNAIYMVLPDAGYRFKEDENKFVKAYGLRESFGGAFLQGEVAMLKMKPL